MRHLDAGDALEQLGEEMVRGAGSGGREGELAGAFLGEPDEVGDRSHRQRRIDHQDVGTEDDERERYEIGGRVVGQLLVQRDVDRHHRARSHQQRVTIRRRARNGERAGHAARARPILDHERLAEPLLQPLCEHACQEFGAAAGCERHHQRDRPGRIIRPRRAGPTPRPRNRSADTWQRDGGLYADHVGPTPLSVSSLSSTPR